MDPEKSRFLNNVLENSVSQLLRNYNRVAIAFREILVTDVYGRLVAASNKISDYFQADERWWLYTYLEDSGSRYISDFHFDESVDVYGIEVGQNGKAVLMHSDGTVIFSPVSVAIVVILSLIFAWLLSKPRH